MNVPASTENVRAARCTSTRLRSSATFDSSSRHADASSAISSISGVAAICFATVGACDDEISPVVSAIRVAASAARGEVAPTI
jgi:hypothetical protein